MKKEIQVEGTTQEYIQALRGEIAVDKDLEKFRSFMCQYFFFTHQNELESEEDTSYTFKCTVCDQSTLYYTKPNADKYKAPLCLSTPCLYAVMKKQGIFEGRERSEEIVQQ